MSAPHDIRPVRPDHPDVAQLLAQLDQYLASLYAPEDNHILGLEALLQPQVTFLGAWEGGRVVGCGAVRACAAEPDTGNQPYGEIKRMMVLHETRGRGLGGALLSCLEQAARGAGLPQVLLETGRAQHEAVRLYERSGFRPHGPFSGYPDNGLSAFYSKALV